MLVKVEPAPFESGKLRHSTNDQMFIGKRKAVNNKSSMGTPDKGKHTASESPKDNVVNRPISLHFLANVFQPLMLQYLSSLVEEIQFVGP